jgi:Ca2+-binding RTX toxin-like protein
MAFGGAGDDVIIVGDPNLATSTLMGFGEVGNDTIYGGAGDDWLVGGQGSDYVWGAGGADVFRFEAGDLAAGDMDILLMGTGEGDLLSFDTSYTGQISAVAGSNGGVAGVYLMSSGSTWMAWLPYQSLANVEAAIVFG